MSSNYNNLRYSIPMILKGFEPLWSENKTYDPKDFFHLSLNDNSFQKQYDAFKERVFNSIGRTFLPIYRMADGEFKFCLQKTSIKKIILSTFKINNNFATTCWGEVYTKKEIREANEKYIKDIRTISSLGILAIHFMEETDSKGYMDYIKPMCAWFERNEIYLIESNYISFYHVYALLCGKDSFELFRNSKVLIITSNSNEKFSKLDKILRSEYNAKDVSFYEISPTKSLLEKIDLEKIDKDVEVVLVSAGIGSSNILTQLDSLKAVCIDAGIVLEVLINKELSKSRFFLKESV